MGIGNLMNQSLTGSQQQAQSSSAGAAPTMPDVMTPSEAASFLKVSEEDVVAAIEAGDLKARKLGNAFRISKSALEEFLNG
jgi:excisionase family DNA binding protein